MQGYLPIIELILLALITGFFFSIEPAIGTLNRFSVELKKKQGKASGRILSEILEHPSKIIGASFIASIIMLTATTLLSIGFSGVLWEILPKEWKDSPLKMIPELITASTILFFSVHLTIPFIKFKSNLFLNVLAKPLHLIFVTLSPVAKGFTNAGEWIMQYIFDVRLANHKDIFSRIDPDQLIQQSKEKGSEETDYNTRNLFENALSLPGVKIRECLIPRKEIIGIDINTEMLAARQKFIDTQLSRLVIYKDNLDHILGYVHQQDLFKKPKDLLSVLHPIPAVPETMGVTDLIGYFTKERKSIAWVVDEFGGTSGIVTMEDLLEEIFGEIKDEYDIEEFIEKEIESGVFIFSGRLELDYLKEKYKVEFDETSESETLSGYIVEFHGTIPKTKETMIIQQLEFEIMNVSDTRIETVKVKKLSKH